MVGGGLLWPIRGANTAGGKIVDEGGGRKGCYNPSIARPPQSLEDYDTPDVEIYKTDILFEK